MAPVEARSIADLERQLREARSRLSEGARELRATRARLEAFATRYQTSVGERFDLLRQLRSDGTGERGLARGPADLAPRADRPPGHMEFERLYRDLARRFHPDLASDSGELAKRTRVMAELNVARETLDYDRARQLGEAWDLRFEDLGTDPSLSLVDRLLLGIERVEARLTAVTADVIRLRHSDLSVLMEIVDAQGRAGIDVLAETAADLDVQIAEARVHLALGGDAPLGISGAAAPLTDTGQRVPAAAAMHMAPLAVGLLLAGSIAVYAAFLAAGSADQAPIVLIPATGSRPTGSPAVEVTAAPLAYGVTERLHSTSGRTTATVRIVLAGFPSPAEKVSTLAEAARREILSRQAVVIYAYRSVDEVGGPYTVGRAYLSVDGRGWDGEGHTEDGPDTGGVVGSIVVGLGTATETQAFRAQR